jgi:hypothetical protein
LYTVPSPETCIAFGHSLFLSEETKQSVLLLGREREKLVPPKFKSRYDARYFGKICNFY